MKHLIGSLLLFSVFHASVVTAGVLQGVPLGDVVVYQQHSAPATVVAKHNSLLSAEVSGSVETILVDVGDSVKQGDALLTVDDFTAQQQYRQVVAAIEGIEARITFAEFQLQQSQRLGKTNNISEELLRQRQMNLVTLKSELTVQQAQREQAQRQIDNSTVTAPFSGVVIERQVQLGAFVNPSMPLLRLLAIKGQQVQASLHREDAAQLPKNSDLTFMLGEQSYALELSALLPMLHAQQRTQLARLDFTNSTALVGASGRLQWRDHRPSLPAQYLQRRDGEMGVFVLRQGEAEFVALPGAQEGRAVRVAQLPLTTQLVNDNTLQRQSTER